MSRTPSMNAFLPTILTLVLLGWGGLVLLMNMTQPTIGPRWLFFFLLVVGFSGLGLPFTVLVNHRFHTNPAAGPNVVVRQALWFGVYAATLAWLQYGQVFSGTLAVIFLLGFIIVELFIRLWERGLWQRR